MRSNTMMWDFWSLSPESLHQVTILFSNRGLPQGYRFINGYGSHTYSFINAANERFWVKFHFKTMQGIKNWTNDEAAKVVGQDRDSINSWAALSLEDLIASTAEDVYKESNGKHSRPAKAEVKDANASA